MKIRTNWVASLSPFTLALYFILIPIAFAFFEFLFGIFAIFRFPNLYLPLHKIGLLCSFYVFLSWIWYIVKVKSTKDNSNLYNDKLFKASILVFTGSQIFDLILQFKFASADDFALMDSLFAIFNSILEMASIAAFVYMAYVVGLIYKQYIIKDPYRSHWLDEFPHLLMIFIYPVGIPILQWNLQRQEKESYYREFNKKHYNATYPEQSNQDPLEQASYTVHDDPRSRRANDDEDDIDISINDPIPTPKATSAPSPQEEENNASAEVKTEKEKEDDHSRFMPKYESEFLKNLPPKYPKPTTDNQDEETEHLNDDKVESTQNAETVNQTPSQETTTEEVKITEDDHSRFMPKSDSEGVNALPPKTENNSTPPEGETPNNRIESEHKNLEDKPSPTDNHSETESKDDHSRFMPK